MNRGGKVFLMTREGTRGSALSLVLVAMVSPQAWSATTTSFVPPTGGAASAATTATGSSAATGGATSSSAATGSAASATNTLTQGTTLNQTQTGMANTVFDACTQRNSSLTSDFRARCDALIGYSSGSEGLNNVQPTENALQVVSPEQIIAQGSQAAKVSQGQVALVSSSIAARLNALYMARGIGLTGTASGRSAPGYAALGSATGGAAGDSDFSRLGAWLNSDYRFGNVDGTFEQNGFQFHNFGITGGVDYRFTDDLLAGLAFTYGRNEADFDRSLGESNSDAYTGSLYLSYYATERFHVEALGTFGGLDYQMTRSINYVLPSFDTVHTRALSNPGGTQYSFSFGGGYDWSTGALTLAPYARTDYIGLDVDAYRENGADGWGMRFNEQHVQSLTSTVGAQASYAVSLPWAVLTPQLRGEWHHQFMDDNRSIGVSFLGDPAAQQFNVVTQGPDRDFYTFGAEVSGAFAQGVSAFLAYDSLLGYRGIDSHRLTVGTRLEF